MEGEKSLMNGKFSSKALPDVLSTRPVIYLMAFTKPVPLNSESVTLATCELCEPNLLAGRFSSTNPEFLFLLS